MLKFEDAFTVGNFIRAYDYNPKHVQDQEIYIEGEVIAIESLPYKAYRVRVTKCTGYGRVDKEILVPMEISSHEFDGRIVPAEQ